MKKGVLTLVLFFSIFMIACQKNASNTETKATKSAPQVVDGSPDQADPNLNDVIIRGGGGTGGSGGGNPCVPCYLSAYPDNSNLPKSSAVFNENQVLVAADPGPSSCGTAPQEIRVWYSDEHAITLGVRRVIIKTSGGSTTKDYPITATPSTPTIFSNPVMGTTAQSGDYSGNDVAAGGGRPLSPVLYITDITYTPTDRSGDWQQGGTGYYPTKIAGTWKAAVKTIDKTRNPARITVTPDADPAKNHWNLGGGGTNPPNGVGDEGFGAMVAWNVDALPMEKGHTYRIQFMVHDGDQNKSGGDVGQACTVIVMRGNGNGNGL